MIGRELSNHGQKLTAPSDQVRFELKPGREVAQGESRRDAEDVRDERCSGKGSNPLSVYWKFFPLGTEGPERARARMVSKENRRIMLHDCRGWTQTTLVVAANPRLALRLVDVSPRQEVQSGLEIRRLPRSTPWFSSSHLTSSSTPPSSSSSSSPPHPRPQKTLLASRPTKLSWLLTAVVSSCSSLPGAGD